MTVLGCPVENDTPGSIPFQGQGCVHTGSG